MNVPVRAPGRFTSAEYHRMARAGAFKDMRIELRRGMLVRMSPQHIPHASVKAALYLALEEAVRAAGLGWLVFSEVSVAATDDFDPMPDIVVWDPAGVADQSGAIPIAAVKLVVEVAETSLADDLGEKLEDYARSGLAEYWVADVKGRLILRHADPGPAGYARREPVLFGQAAAWLTAPLALDTSRLV
ncbi:MAG: Uma2 family endonuclease [Alphaproteobacteria bacterium]|nr:Uma2 family endonuclease [Alphaproteobacteria bacterium]